MHRWEPRRIVITRLFLLVGWPPVVTAMMIYYCDIMHKLEGVEPTTGATVGKQWAWSTEWNTEYVKSRYSSVAPIP